jgi:hypothetical protein
MSGEAAGLDAFVGGSRRDAWILAFDAINHAGIQKNGHFESGFPPLVGQHSTDLTGAAGGSHANLHLSTDIAPAGFPHVTGAEKA